MRPKQNLKTTRNDRRLLLAEACLGSYRQHLANNQRGKRILHRKLDTQDRTFRALWGLTL